jgi:hypothetical protein
MLPYIFRGSEFQGFLIEGWSHGGADDLLRLAPGNRPPAEPYLCIVPLRDAWRADRALTEAAGLPHFSSALEPAVLDDVRRGRALLLLDLSNEGMGWFGNVFEALHDFAAGAGIPLSRLVWLDQNRALPGHYRTVLGLGEAGIGFEHYDFFVKHLLWMFSPRHPAAVIGPDPEAHITRMFDPGAKDKLLLCLNATPRLHRVVALGGLIHHGLFDESLVSFPGIDRAKDGDVGSEERMEAHLAAHPELAYLTEGCRRAMALRNLQVDSFSETGNALFNRIDPEPYRRTFLSLVTETELTDGHVQRVTEKAVKPFCLGHPTLVLGNPGSIRFMTELGFHDFAPALDHLYDRDNEPPRRLNRIMGQLVGLAMAIRMNPGAWLGRVREVGAANIRHAASGRALDTYVTRHERPLFERLHRRLHATP